MELWELCDLETPWSVHVVATLRIADHIAAGMMEIRALAKAAGCDRDSLHRVLRHLAGKGLLFVEPSHGHFELNELGRKLLDPSALAGIDLNGIGGRMAYSWSTLLTAVRTGKPAYHEVFGRSFWEDLEANPEVAASFDELMGPGHGVPDPNVLLDPKDWDSVRTVVDVGGGTGSLLAEVLRAHPDVRGTLVDLPRPIAHSGEVFQAADVADRVTTVAQSFFDPLPGGADLYLLKSVIADWPDDDAIAILRRCAEAARPDGRVVVFTQTDPEAQASPELLMLVLVGGKGRSFEDFQELAREAGLKVVSAGRQPSGKGIVECRPA